MGCAKPERGLLRPPLCRLFSGSPLPRAVIDVAKTLDWLRFKLERRSDRRGCIAAAAQRAGVNGLNFPCLDDVVRDSLSLPAPQFGERQLSAAAKPLRRDPVDMSVP